MAYLHKEPIEPSAATLKNLFIRDPEKGRCQIGELLDLMMEPSHQSLENRKEELADWVKALFTTEKSFEEFCAKVSVYDQSPLCGCVWTKNFVAYRCKTCATSPCMSICAACFERGNHEGHEYNIFRSEAGGACDCGDSNVMDPSGFCTRHGPNRVAPDDVPANLMTLPKFIMERILIMLVHSLRYLEKDKNQITSFVVHMPKPLCETLDVFIEAIKCGSAVRSWVGDLLLSEEYYESLNSNQHFGGVVTEEMKNYHKECFQWFPKAVKLLTMCDIPEEIGDKKRFSKSNVVYKNLLQELMFWTCRFEFPEHLILFILNMLPDDRVKQEFARCFMRHYIYIPPSLIDSAGIEEYSNRIVHISVQLFSNSELAYMLAEEEALLEIFMIALNYMVTKKLTPSGTTDADYHQTVSRAGEGIRSCAYWAIVSDFVNCLGHHSVAKLFLNNDDSLKIWMWVLTCFSGMNLVLRQSNRHVDYDPHNILHAFHNERETCAAPLWVMLDILRDPSTLSLSLKMITFCKDAIVELLDALGVEDPKGTDIPFNKISFHYPIHRYFSLFVANAISRQGMSIQDFEMDEKMARLFMLHPLHLLCISQEVLCNLWIRNGMNIVTQQLAYRQTFFCTFFIDADLFMLQLCSCYMNPDIFISSLLDRCRVTNCLTVETETKPLQDGTFGANGQPDEDKLPKMMEGAFTILLSVLSISTQLGLTDNEIIEKELMATLSFQNCTHSQLTDHIPQCHDMHAGEKSKRFTEPVSEAIEEISYKIEGDAMEQTQHSLRDDYWRKYDPIFLDHRALYKKYVHKAHSNYFKFLQRTANLPTGTWESNIWPPFRPIRITDNRYSHLNGILNCRTLHTIIFMILYKYLQKHQVITEQTLIMAMTLLEGSLYASSREEPNEETQNLEGCVKDSGTADTDWQRMLGQWFRSDNMTTNIRQVIDQVQVPLDNQEIFHDAMETDEELGNQPNDNSSDAPERCVVIQESILSMLIKLHDRYTGINDSFVFPAEFEPDLDPPDVIVTTAPNVITKILLLAASKSPQNQKVITSLCPTSAVVTPVVNDDKTRYAVERERRKKKAFEMQQRLLKEFASKQRRFLEQTEMLSDLPENQDEGETAASPDVHKLDCVICGSSEESKINVTGDTLTERANSAKSQIMALIGLAQSSSLLGFRTEADEQRPLRPTCSSLPVVDNCRKANIELHGNLKSKFPTEMDSFTLGHNFDWEWAPHLSTCGHHIHVSCYRDYMKWVRRDETGYIRFEEGIGFQCPLCRQTSNIVIPCNIAEDRRKPDEILRQKLKPHKSDSNLSEEDQKFHRNLWNVHSSIVTNEPERTILVFDEDEDDIDPAGPSSSVDPVRVKQVSILSVDEVLKTCDDTVNEILMQNKIVIEKDTTVHLTSRSILQGQLEYDLCRLGGSLLVEKRQQQLSPIKRNIPLGPICHMLMKTMRVKGDIPNNEYAEKIWNQLIGDPSTAAASSECPLLMKDPIALLIELCVSLYPFTLEEYQTVVQVLYNLCMVQSLVHMSCKFSPEERRAWKANVSASIGGTPFDSSRLDCLLGLVISSLPRSLFEDNSAARLLTPPSARLFTSTVWSPQSVQSSLEDFLLHFMRISALLQFHYFENMSTVSTFRGVPTGGNEFLHLAKYLGMVNDECTSPTDSFSTSLVKWPKQPRIIVTQWCKEVEKVILADRQTSFSLLTRHRIWKQPTLVKLPEDYTNLFTKFRDIKCPSCKRPPREPCVCLLCGEFVCFRGPCLHPRSQHDDDDSKRNNVESRSAAAHAKKCGNGTIVLLHVQNTTIVVVRGMRYCVWGTLYLDHHGEEDQGWKRGRQLLIKPERLKLLRYQWLNHIFDNSCKNWMKHRNQL